jgi:chemotaxis protein MotB
MAKKKHEEHENHERWLVSYADFITLLFAFFVVMYSISAVNEGKFRTVSESIKAALNPMQTPPASSKPFQVGENKSTAVQPSVQTNREQVIRRLQIVTQSAGRAVKIFIDPASEQRVGDIVLTISDHVLFKPGEATLQPEALPFLRGLADVLVELDRHVKIEGHTDNVPIRTALFPSNWELSAARSVMIVRVLSELYGVPASHLAAIGYGETRPLTANLDPDQRAKNRRVEVIILENAPSSARAHTEESTGDPSDSLAMPGSSNGQDQPTLPAYQP